MGTFINLEQWDVHKFINKSGSGEVSYIFMYVPPLIYNIRFNPPVVEAL